MLIYLYQNFTKSGSKQNVYGKSYSSTWQDFNANLNNQTMRLDAWVFNTYLEWLQSSAAETVKNQDGIILFFHLLGCDTVGHAKKPHSRFDFRFFKLNCSCNCSCQNKHKIHQKTILQRVH